MSNTKLQPDSLAVGKLSKEWAQFYHALGTFNTNIVARVIKDPGRVAEVTKQLTAWCPEHDLQCASGFIWDHQNDSCVRFVEVDPNQ